MKESISTDYETYREIMHELLSPIQVDGLDADMVKRLYESKAVYLENLRLKCFKELNGNPTTHFTTQDYALIIEAIHETKVHLRDLILTTVAKHLANRKVS